MPRHRRGWGINGENGFQHRHTPMTVPLLEPALLILLKEQPRHGYTLLNDLEALGMSMIHPSVVYRTLRDMESLEWIVSDWDTAQSQGPPRRIYTLTPQGEDALRGWQHELEKTQGLIVDLLKRIA